MKRRVVFPALLVLLPPLMASPSVAQSAGDVIRLLEGVVREMDRPATAPAPDYRRPPEQAQVYAPRTAGRADQVREVQAALNRLGYPAGPVDGVMGPGTRAALIAFQRAAGLPADGRIGPATLAALRRGGSGRPAGGT